MKRNHTFTQPSPSLAGGICGALSFLIWGLSPLYWKQLANIPAFEILMHRMVWSFAFLLPILLFQGRFNHFLSAFKERRTLLPLLFSTLIIGGNWFLFIWAINHNHILETSLGYYINPLVNVLLGMVFFKERLRSAQWIAVALATAGVGYLTFGYGKFPWISLTLAVTFGLYGLIRKMVPVTALAGLCVETFLLSIPAMVYLCYLDVTATGAMFRISTATDLLLAGTSLVTAFPLLLFSFSARRIYLSTLGFLQYIAPSCTFLLGVYYYHEPVSSEQILTFALIWTALVIYSIDSFTASRKPVPSDPL